MITNPNAKQDKYICIFVIKAAFRALYLLFTDNLIHEKR